MYNLHCFGVIYIVFICNLHCVYIVFYIVFYTISHCVTHNIAASLMQYFNTYDVYYRNTVVRL